jgi:hypothetical protein
MPTAGRTTLTVNSYTTNSVSFRGLKTLNSTVYTLPPPPR